jgi:preprotein translocase subunit SecE
MGGFKISMAFISPVTFGREAVDELKKVTWPTRTEVIRLTVSVIVISVIVGLFLGGIDLLLTRVLERLVTR